MPSREKLAEFSARGIPHAPGASGGLCDRRADAGQRNLSLSASTGERAGVCARIKEELLTGFNLRTIVLLPNGVLSPYTGIPTDLLFFDRSGPMREVWYYEQPLPEGRKKSTKTAPIQFEESATLCHGWGNRKETDQAWNVPAAELPEYDKSGSLRAANLDREAPRAREDLTHLPPAQRAASIPKKEQRIAEIMGRIQTLLTRKP